MIAIDIKNVKRFDSRCAIIIAVLEEAEKYGVSMTIKQMEDKLSGAYSEHAIRRSLNILVKFNWVVRSKIGAYATGFTYQYKIK